MPYEGRQAVACHAQASACLKHGYAPRWHCDDRMKRKYGHQNALHTGR